MNGQIVYVHVYRRLLTNHLHGKAAELYVWLTAEITV